MLHSVAMIKLDIQVKKLTHDDWYIFGDEQGVRIVIVDLKAQEEKDFELEKTKSVVVAKKDNDEIWQRMLQGIQRLVPS